MCPPGYHHNDLVATRALGHMMYGWATTVLWHMLWLSLLLSYHLLECFDSILTRTIETQHCQVFQSHFLLIFIFCWNNCLPKL